MYAYKRLLRLNTNSEYTKNINYIFLTKNREENTMAETRAIKKSSSKKKKQKTAFLEEINIFQLLKVIFLIFLSLLIVYLYYLHTKGTLISNMAVLWKSHKKVIMIIFGFAFYSLGVFYLGYRKGRKR
ncbi:hypothetical protein ACT8ZR_11850 [Neobacillus sp. M.A.Huq-85]|nr:hypothetical protein QNK12_29120 [Neobacillus cucumis]